MARSKLSSQISLEGPFFRVNPGKTFRQNVRVLMDRISEEGEADVQQMLRSGEGSRAPLRDMSPNRVSGHVVGRTSNLAGKRWAVTAVVSINNRGLSRAQGIRLMAAASRLEGRLHVFRRSSARMRKARALNKAELLKGLK
jgi:hypothetical protein